MYDSEALREKGVAIVQRLRDAVDLWKEETGYGFSPVSYTHLQFSPAASSAGYGYAAT